MAHYTEDDLTLYYYGEAPHRDRIEQHLQECGPCATTYREIARNKVDLSMVGVGATAASDAITGTEFVHAIRHRNYFACATIS